MTSPSSFWAQLSLKITEEKKGVAYENLSAPTSKNANTRAWCPFHKTSCIIGSLMKDRRGESSCLWKPEKESERANRRNYVRKRAHRGRPSYPRIWLRVSNLYRLNRIPPLSICPACFFPPPIGHVHPRIRNRIWKDGTIEQTAGKDWVTRTIWRRADSPKNVDWVSRNRTCVRQAD